MVDWITDYHGALLFRLSGIALVLGAWIAYRMLARRIRGQRQIDPPVPEPIIPSDPIGQGTAKKPATRPSLPVH